MSGGVTCKEGPAEAESVLILLHHRLNLILPCLQQPLGPPQELLIWHLTRQLSPPLVHLVEVRSVGWCCVRGSLWFSPVVP